MPLVQTRGAASAQGFGEFAQAAGSAVNYIEDVFSTYLYTGTGTTNTITNNIDLSTKGGLVWMKSRSNAFYHGLYDTVRGTGTGTSLYSNTNEAQGTNSTNQNLTAFNTTGFTLGATSSTNVINGSGDSLVSWTFRKQPKFFDIQTWTGTGVNRTIAHALGSIPGCIIVKRTDTTADWAVYHRSLANTQYLVLNSTAAAATGATWWNSTTPTSSVFSLGTDATVNASAGTYVAYLFAHDAGGFGLTGTDNVISCGSFVGTGSDLSVNLGYEPQWLLVKRASSGTENWAVYDNMRGMFVNYDDNILFPNTNGAEVQIGRIAPTATGFNVTSGYPASGTTYIYIAIRRGPMKVPTTGTSVFIPITAAADPSNVSVGFPTDLFLANKRAAGSGKYALSRLTGGPQYLTVTSADAEVTYAGTKFDLQNNFTSAVLYGSTSTISYMFGRAPSFFDEVCYTGTGSARTLSHNLAAVPELMIVKSRDLAQGGAVYTASTGNANYLRLFSTGSDSGETATSFWNSTTPTASVFSLGTANNVNGNTNTYVAYLFATCAGVSKVGSYTGTGSTQTINCGFTGGARFVLIKKSTSTAPDRDWYVWDTARGMTSGTDPSLKINTTAAEVNANDVYTITTGFQLVSSSDYVNASGVTYIFLAIA